jgi:hypothetical protein
MWKLIRRTSDSPDRVCRFDLVHIWIIHEAQESHSGHLCRVRSIHLTRTQRRLTNGKFCRRLKTGEVVLPNTLHRNTPIRLGRSWVRAEAGAIDLSQLQNVYNCSEAHPASYSLGKGGSDNWTSSSAGVLTSTHPMLQDAYFLPYVTVHSVHCLQLIERQSLVQIIHHQMTVSTTRTAPWWIKGQIIRYKVRETIWMRCLNLQSRTAKQRTWYNEELLL